MMQILNTLVPVFALIALGYLLGKRSFVSASFQAELNRLVFWVPLPALIVHSLATASELPRDTLPILAIFIAATLLVLLLAFPISRVLGLRAGHMGTFVQACFRGNLAYAGLPILVYALQPEPEAERASAVAQLMFVFAPAMLLYNSMGVILLIGKSEHNDGGAGSILRKVATNPLILASIAGLGLFLVPWSLPRFLLNTLELCGQMAAPAALFCVGGAVATIPLQGRYRSAALATALKVLVLPGIAWLLALILGLKGTPLLVLLIMSACPTAVASYVMVKEMDGDEGLAAGAIILSTAACIPVLALILAIA
jgi:predicted permease